MEKSIPLNGDNYLDDLLERFKRATNNFKSGAEIRIPPSEALEFDIGSKITALSFKTGKVVSCDFNDDNSATITIFI